MLRRHGGGLGALNGRAETACGRVDTIGRVVDLRQDDCRGDRDDGDSYEHSIAVNPRWVRFIRDRSRSTCQHVRVARASPRVPGGRTAAWSYRDVWSPIGARNGLQANARQRTNRDCDHPQMFRMQIDPW